MNAGIAWLTVAEGAQVVCQRGIAYCCSVLLLHSGILIFESNCAALLVLSFSSTRWPKHAFKLSRRSETLTSFLK